MNPTPPLNRVIVYIDGFNLYFGMRTRHWRRYYWLNVEELGRRLLKPGQDLCSVKYFTSQVSENKGKARRQRTYLEALEVATSVRIIYGKYQFNKVSCRMCSADYLVPQEKMTDVNIAVEMMADAFEDRYDTAVLVSADSDLSGAVQTVARLFPRKRVIIAFPPARHSADLGSSASHALHIGQDKLRASQLPDEITKPCGYVLRRPEEWR